MNGTMELAGLGRRPDSKPRGTSAVSSRTVDDHVESLLLCAVPKLPAHRP